MSGGVPEASANPLTVRRRFPSMRPVTDRSPDIASAEARDARLARALRDNLRRRKEQARARRAEATPETADGSAQGKPAA